MKKPRGVIMVKIEMENGGIITLELYEDKAPITVANFKSLVEKGFYDGLIFHRVISGFMIQGGDPTGTGMGGSGEHIKGEFASNGFPNDISHERGVISMARSQRPNSASSQFFIMHADGKFLDGEYAAFGKVTSGLEVVYKIAETRTTANDKPTRDVVIETIVIDEKITTIGKSVFEGNKNLKIFINITENDLKLPDNWNSGLPTYYKGAWELVDGLPTVIE